MGCYINPPDTTKERWLQENADEVGSLRWPPPPDKLPVVLVDNGMFTAAGVAYSEEELEELTNPNDYRLKLYFYAPIDKLSEVSNLDKYMPSTEAV